MHSQQQKNVSSKVQNKQFLCTIDERLTKIRRETKRRIDIKKLE